MPVIQLIPSLTKPFHDKLSEALCAWYHERRVRAKTAQLNCTPQLKLTGECCTRSEYNSCLLRPILQYKMNLNVQSISKSVLCLRLWFNRLCKTDKKDLLSTVRRHPPVYKNLVLFNLSFQGNERDGKRTSVIRSISLIGLLY